MNEYCYQERHMGTEVSLSFVCDEVMLADALAAETFATIHTYEMIFSRFLSSSELSQVNTQGSKKVSPEFMAVLKKSNELHALTAGAFNPLLQVQALGYTKTYADLSATNIQVSPIEYDTEVRAITIDTKKHSVTLGKNQKLDFGGVLKGYVATKLADEIILKYPACHGVIINIGGDLATRGYDEIHEPFIFELYNPVTGEETSIALTDTSLATSGTYARNWQTESGERHHIVDGASLENPTTNIVSVSIIHRDGAVAEGLTKLFLTKGVKKALTTASPSANKYMYFVVYNDGKVYNNFL